MVTLQNGQTHSNNSPASADELFECDHFVELTLKELSRYSLQDSMFGLLSEVLHRKNFLRQFRLFGSFSRAHSSPQNRLQTNEVPLEDRQVTSV